MIRVVYKMLVLSIIHVSGINPALAAITIESGPSIKANPFGRAPLTAVVELRVNVPVKPTLIISDGVESKKVEFVDYQQQMVLPVLGLKPSRSYSIEVLVEDTAGGAMRFSSLPAITTGPLPSDFPIIEVLKSNVRKMSPGYILFNAKSGKGAGASSYGIILDPEGEVVWYSDFITPHNPKMQANGNVLRRRGLKLFEASLLGESKFLADLQDTGSALHHEFKKTDYGTYVSLTGNRVAVDNYPTSYTNPDAPRQAVVIDDEPVVEFSLDGSVLNMWSMAEMLDTTRIGYFSLRDQPDGTGIDWGHANAVTHDPADDSFIVSMRHQDAVVKFSRETGLIKWILGPHANWTVPYQQYLLQDVGFPFEWQYHQHAPQLTPNGTLIMFDNGNARASPFDGTVPMRVKDAYSRVVEFKVDEPNMQVRQVWQYRPGSERIYSFFISEADYLPKHNNVLVTFGGVSHVDGIKSADLGFGELHARLIEVTHDNPPEEVFDARIVDRNINKLTIYRSEKIDSLYSGSVATLSDLKPRTPFEIGVASMVDNSNWTTVRLGRRYASMVVATSPVYDKKTRPLVVRVRNAKGSSFDVRVDRADGLAEPIAGIDIHYLAVEEGVYVPSVHGIKMEAVKFTSTVTDRKGSFIGELRSYANEYSLPIIVGQVMSYNDPGISSFWSRGVDRKTPPSASSLYIGKHIGEDVDTTRSAEEIGYIVVEAGLVNFSGTAILAGRGDDIVSGIRDDAPYSYSLSGLSSASVAVVSQAAMDGGDGGHALLYAPNPVSASLLNLAIDEDQIADLERWHTTEQVDFIVIGAP